MKFWYDSLGMTLLILNALFVISLFGYVGFLITGYNASLIIKRDFSFVIAPVIVATNYKEYI